MNNAPQWWISQLRIYEEAADESISGSDKENSEPNGLPALSEDSQSSEASTSQVSDGEGDQSDSAQITQSRRQPLGALDPWSLEPIESSPETDSDQQNPPDPGTSELPKNRHDQLFSVRIDDDDDPIPGISLDENFLAAIRIGSEGDTNEKLVNDSSSASSNDASSSNSNSDFQRA